MLSALFCVALLSAASGVTGAQRCECPEAIQLYSCHTDLWQCKDFMIEGGLVKVGSYQDIRPKSFVHFIPVPSPTTTPWYCHISLAVSRPVNITILLEQLPQHIGRNESILWTKSHILLGEMISLNLPKLFHQFSIKLMFDTGDDLDLQLKLNYFVLTQNEHLQVCNQPCVLSWVPIPTTVTSSSISYTSAMTSPTPSSSLISSTFTSSSNALTSIIASPTPPPSPAVPPTSEVARVRLTWDKNNSVLVQWDHVISDDITGYKLHWSSQPIRNEEISTSCIVNTNLSQFLIQHTNNVLMDAIELYVYIWTYNLAGDGPVTNSTIIKPFTSLQCIRLSLFSLHYQWTEHVTVTRYNVSHHCSRTGSDVNESVKTPPTEKTFSKAEPDCLYSITMRAEGHDGYLLNCYTSTPELTVLAVFPNQSFSGDSVLVNISVGNAWTGSINITIPHPQLIEPTSLRSNYKEDNFDINWMIYSAAACMVIIMALVITVMILALKIHRNGKNKITNHQEKIISRHESNSTR